jgi:ribosomal protein L2
MHKVLSLVFLSSGSVTYVQTSTNHELFRLARFRGTFKRSTLLHQPLMQTQIHLPQFFYLLRQLPKNQPICLLESTPGKGIQYARSPGTKATMLKMDSRVSTSLVKLPSGVRKIFSTYSLASLGYVALPNNKKAVNNKAGYNHMHGRKPKVRGVAMNPVDHPHGGRTKTIKHPRTPWGATTKLK